MLQITSSSSWCINKNLHVIKKSRLFIFHNSKMVAELDNYPFFLCLLLLVILLGCGHGKAQTPSSTQQESPLLRVPVLKVEARVRVARANSTKIDQDIRVTEYYSNILRQAKIVLHNLSDVGNVAASYNDRITHFYKDQDGFGQFVRVQDSGVSRIESCQPVSEEIFARDLFNEAAYIDGHLTGKIWLKKRDDVPDYLVGVTRMLLIIERNRDKLVEVKVEPTIRNIPAIQYKYEDTFATPKGFGASSYGIYYAKSTNHEQHIDYPIRIWFKSATGTELIMDFYFMEIYPENKIMNDIGSANLFTYPLHLDCSQYMPPTDVLNYDSGPKLVSFRLEIVNKNDNSDIRSYFLAHDDFAEATRIDTIKTGVGRSTSEYSITIKDLKKNKKYNIRQSQRAIKDSFLPISDRQCVSAAIEFGVGADAGSYDPVIPLGRLVSLGTVYVRGVETEAFEHLSNKLPTLFFPMLTYRKADGTYEETTDPDEPQATYAITYYFSTTVEDEESVPTLWLRNRPLGPLMQIDIRLRKRMIYQMNIYDFVWGLADAPNGDSRSELFAVRDRCQENDLSTSTERYADLELDLEYKKSNQLVQLSPSEAIELIHGPSAWAQELIRALVINTKLSSTNIYDLEATIQPVSEDKMLIKVRAGLADVRPAFFEALKIGTGIVQNSHDPSLANNFEECFFDAAHKTGTQGTVFTYCFDICFIDSTPTIEKNEAGLLELKKSKIFSTTGSSGLVQCQLFVPTKIEPTRASSTSVISIWSSIYVTLQSRLLSLPLTSVYKKPVDMLNFHVRRVEINNNKWLGDASGIISNVRPELDSQVLKGIGLSVEISKRILPKQPVVGNLDLEATSFMSYELCHTRCMSNIRCSSFSICTLNSQSNLELECLISEFQFRNSTLIGEIEEKSRRFKSEGRRETITVDMLLERAGSDPMTKQVALRVDPRCRIYNKNALEVFRRMRKETIDLRSWENNSLLAVEDEEQCAERCIQLNVGFFAKASRDKLELLRKKQSLSDYSYLKTMRALQKSNLDTWCSSFSYVDVESIPKEAKALFSESKLKKNGVCAISRYTYTSEDESQKANENVSDKIEVVLNRFAFIYNSLYEKQPGLRMKNNWPKELELFGDRQVTIEELESFMKDHNKQHVKEVNRPEQCAKLCFKQSMSLDFWCKSFGTFHQDIVDGRASGQIRSKTYCIFNSMTLSEARRSENASYLYEEIPSTLGYVHYEPLDSLAIDDSMITRLLLRDNRSVIDGLKIGHFSLLANLIFIVLSLVGGIILGIKSGYYLIESSSSDRRDSVQNSTRTFLGGLVSGIGEVSHQRFEPEIDMPNLKDF